MRTSASDYAKYREICRKAAEDDLVFEFFRRHPIYIGVVELSRGEEGLENINIALSNDQSIMNNIDDLRRNDDFGSPLVLNYSLVGRFSPNTLRYIKIATDLKKLFGPLDGMRIVEIGGGFGGQARIIHALNNNIKSYTIFDLPEAQALTRRYLGCYGIDQVQFPDLSIAPVEADLVISNYAFAEIDKGIQTRYVENVVSKAKHGYMILNSAQIERDMPGFALSAQQLQAMVPNSHLDSNHPLLPPSDLRWSNVLWHW